MLTVLSANRIGLLHRKWVDGDEGRFGLMKRHTRHVAAGSEVPSTRDLKDALNGLKIWSAPPSGADARCAWSDRGRAGNGVLLPQDRGRAS